MVDGLLSPGHLVVLLVVVLLVFGPKRLPELGRSLGAGMRGFKDAIAGHDDEPRQEAPAQPTAVATASGPVTAQKPPAEAAARDAAEPAP